MSNFVFPRLRMMMAMVVTAVLMAACGGGGTAADNVGSGGTGYISGAAVKGPVGHATITAHGINGGQMGAQIGTATTDVNGNFSMAIGNYAGPVLLQMSGGSYTDEATGASMSMALGDVMTAVMPSVAAGASNSGVQVTPLTAMAQAMAQHMTGGITDANIAAANTAIGNKISPRGKPHTPPPKPLRPGFVCA